MWNSLCWGQNLASVDWNCVGNIVLGLIQMFNTSRRVFETLLDYFQAKIVCSDMNGAPCRLKMFIFGIKFSQIGDFVMK